MGELSRIHRYSAEERNSSPEALQKSEELRARFFKGIYFLCNSLIYHTKKSWLELAYWCCMIACWYVLIACWWLHDCMLIRSFEASAPEKRISLLAIRTNEFGIREWGLFYWWKIIWKCISRELWRTSQPLFNVNCINLELTQNGGFLSKDLCNTKLISTQTIDEKINPAAKCYTKGCRKNKRFDILSSLLSNVYCDLSSTSIHEF